MKTHIAEKLEQLLEQMGVKEKVETWIEKPKHPDMGDFAFPCFRLARTLKQAPNQIAEKLVQDFSIEGINRAVAVGGYVNFYLDIPTFSAKILSRILHEGPQFGDQTIGHGEKITIDLSSPNIAKPFSMGHLRSTVIGNAIANIVEKVGYKPVRINHIGDWGTQFGKLITAYKKWGDEEQVKRSPIVELHKLYVYFHEQAELNEDLNEEARHWFRKLEDGDQEATELWKWFRAVSLDAFSLVYDKMNISFDSYNGEAFYNDKMDAVINKLSEAKLLEESDGAMVVRLEDNLPPCLIQKRDGATLYATRDLAAAFYRKDQYSFAKSLYVVGNEQSLHFKQLKAVLKKLNAKWADDLVHISFGMMLKDSKKMSTRKGKVVLLEEVLDKSVEMAAEAIEKKNPSLENKESVAQLVGVGAVMFHDLKVFRKNDVHFELEEMLRFEGETGPYVQYAHARACSLVRNVQGSEVESAAAANTCFSSFGEEERMIVFQLSEFEGVITEAFTEWDPSKIAKYAVDLAQHFNHYYAHTNILKEKDPTTKIQQLLLIKSIIITLKESLRLLGIAAPEKM
ncbi:arginine--tRNA ligase [Jeotgalibacillus sp. S-D1]|uniref:arginine--tRNA ligase n=1 Tax=Jeotgalibacillus sp. S-D1 TaxID=2552189 RepID=UPI00105A8CBB|nr:arginine--tRNA ligase [Jeotgalibacillus sp. S-D1]TDL33073.1 arginine--tRNA ligase [Jeotgalibacillus sp. S-D1]